MMKTKLTILGTLLLCLLKLQNAWAQNSIEIYKNPALGTYYEQRLSFFRKMPVKENAIVFLGNSITDGAEWSELFANANVLNRGISGDITAGVLYRLDEVIRHKPDKVFLLIGVNDLSRNIQTDSILKNMFRISTLIRQQSPRTKLYIQSILPVSDVYHLFKGHTDKGSQILEINEALQTNANKYSYTFINLYPYFTDENGKLRAELSNDGLHLKGSAYILWKNIISSYVQNLVNDLPLIPFPINVKLQSGSFDLQKFNQISANLSLKNEADYLKNALQSLVQLQMVNANSTTGIQLELDKNMTESEGYKLEITFEKISITAQNSKGVFYGIQTLIQLANNTTNIPICSISDAPAFDWRGYMIDVGRNFQSIEIIKKQIEKLAFYKYNVFHFHLTEDVAWRFAIKKYPQLTAAKNMTRNAGEFYTEANIKDLMQFCKDRYILFLPEIDMPGHSKAFERAFGTSMQTEKGLKIVKNILEEVLDTYQFKYLHIGGDEVEITNKEFIPIVTKFIESKGCKVMAWNPGGNLLPGTIQQLWMRDIPNGSVVDSRHAYINHFDPEESVITLFQRKFLKSDKGDENKLGAELCLWHDRKQNHENDNFTMNPVYPSMLAFAERIWNGGGVDSISSFLDANLPKVNNAFQAFENRLMAHKSNYFKQLTFNYVQQSQMHWKLIGPFQNNGMLTKSFAPEKTNFNFDTVRNYLTVQGATIVLRHFWAPFIQGVIPNATENSTWYAYTKFWSDKDTIAQAWLGAYDMSRSYLSSNIEPYKWSELGTQFFVNQQEVKAPNWEQKKTSDLEIPFINEGYSYRIPTQIPIKKGWNKVLVKLPVAKFQGKSWYQPIKWEFTFTFVDDGDGMSKVSLPGVYNFE